ncbi:MAG: flagellar filament capping protein FliD [Bryobacterales bacterium]|nr:flagellar filament capping protein FliD [Bryobacterales bacterium]
MATTNPIFTGTSRYSADLQKILERSVNIASLPLLQLQQTKTRLQDQSQALQGLEAKFAALAHAVAALATGAASGSYTLSNSDGAVVMASLSGSVLPGTYTIEVLSAGSFTTTLSRDGLPTVTDPGSQNLSVASSLTLTVDGVNYTIAPSSPTLNGLAEAINAAGAGVTATIINLGSPGSPDYRLSLRAGKLGAVSVQLNDGTQDLLTTTVTGTLATYRINGQPATPISSDSRSVVVAPGLSVTLLKAGTATLTVARGTAAISQALNSFVTAYNDAVAELDKHRGKAGGALGGNSLLVTLSEALRSIVGYSAGSGALRSLEALGLSFNDQGRLSFDASAFEQATGGRLSDLLQFLGSPDTGGFLKAATGALQALREGSDGLLSSAISSVAAALQRQEARIAAEQERIDLLEKNLAERMAAADALIAALEQKVRYFNTLFEAMRIARESLIR